MTVCGIHYFEDKNCLNNRHDFKFYRVSIFKTSPTQGRTISSGYVFSEEYSYSWGLFDILLSFMGAQTWFTNIQPTFISMSCSQTNCVNQQKFNISLSIRFCHSFLVPIGHFCPFLGTTGIV